MLLCGFQWVKGYPGNVKIESTHMGMEEAGPKNEEKDLKSSISQMCSREMV